MSVIGKKRPGYVRLNQYGMASILITMITMIVISLIVLGFATIVRREQSNTLDQQLSTQAFYAAETGIADARYIVMNDVKNNQPIVSKTNCTSNISGGTYPTGAQTVLDNTNGNDVSYTCLLVTPVVTAKYQGIDQQSKVVPISAGQPITKLIISWTPTGNTNPSGSQCATSTTDTFSPTDKWSCDYGLLRMDLVPTQGMPDLYRSGANSLENEELTAFFEPLKSGGKANLSYSGSLGQPNIVGVTCTSQCSITIKGMANTDSLALRLNSLYQASDVTISAYHGGTKLKIIGLVTIDATGNANGVLRRIQVQAPTYYNSNLIPDAAVESSGAVCKHFDVTPTYFDIPGSGNGPDNIVDPDSGNAMCVQKTSGTP